MPCWMSPLMSNKQDKDSLLADQEDALGLYFDSMLSTDENDLLENNNAHDTEHSSLADIAEQLDIVDKSEPKKTENKLQAAKDFLQASKQRQETHKEKKQKSHQKNEPGEQIENKQPAETKQVIDTKLSLNKKKVITSGPASPKPRPQVDHVKEKKINTHSEIIFTTKNNNGEVNEQVLIPRSQRLMAAEKQTQGVAKSMSQTDTMQIPIPQKMKAEKTIAPENDKKIINGNVAVNQASLASEQYQSERALSETKKIFPKTVKAISKEAPKIDLSLFLPKIKTLTEEEIAQQIEALTQAAVSQAKKESDLAHVAELEQVSQKILKTQSEPDSQAQNIDNAPSWATPDFQVLLFMVAGLKLAVPLTELNGIIEWGDEYITELPGHKSWYLGIIQNQGKSVPVIDTMQQVVPQNRWPANHLKEREFKHIILIGDAQWGLACEKVLEIVTLKTDAVKWRSSRTKRRWLLGTVIDHMCALLDSSEFASMLKTGDDSLMSS